MANIRIPSDNREFRCNHCNGKVLSPRNLPSTTGPCPHCRNVISSPAREVEGLPAMRVAALHGGGGVSHAVAVLPQVPIAAVMPSPSGSGIISVPAPVNPKWLELPVAPFPIAAVPSPVPLTTRQIPQAKDPSLGEDRPPKAVAVSAERKKKSRLIAAMLGLLVLLGGAGIGLFFSADEMGRNIPPPIPPATVVNPADKEADYIRTGWQQEAYQLLRNYMAATSSEEKLQFILGGQEMKTRLDEFYSGGVIDDSDTPADAFSIHELSEEDRKRGLFMMVYDQTPPFEMMEFFRPLEPLEVQYEVKDANLLPNTHARAGTLVLQPSRVHAFFKRTSAGLKLDWEIFAQTKYRTFENFVEFPDPGQMGVFRVYIVEDVPDTGHIEAETRTYRIADPANKGDTARVTVTVDSEMGRALSMINWRGTKESRPIIRTATVELRWAGGPDAPELELNRFLCWEYIGLGGQETPSTASTK